MASKTGGGALLIVGLFLVAVVANPDLRTRLSDMFGDGAGGTAFVGEGEAQVAVAAAAEPDVRDCAVSTVSTAAAAGATGAAGAAGATGQGPAGPCGDLRFVIIDAARMPFVARNISTAWDAGKDGELTRDLAAEAVNRAKVCPPSFPVPHGGQCTEYPFAASREGGAGPQEQEVPARENQCRDAALARGYAQAGIGDGVRFRVVITHPAKIASTPFQGVDIAEDQQAGC